jgi:chromosome segregation ATPase
VFSLYDENSHLSYAAEVTSEREQEIAVLKQERQLLAGQIQNLKQETVKASDQAFQDLEPMIIDLSDQNDQLSQQIALLRRQLEQSGTAAPATVVTENPAVVKALTQERDNLLSQVSGLQTQLSSALSGAQNEISQQMQAILKERDGLAKGLANLTGERDSLKSQIGQLESQIQNFISQAQNGEGSSNLNQLIQGFKLN